MPKFCDYCGEPLQEGAKFCMGCGHPVNAASQVAEEPSQQPASEPALQQQPEPQQQPWPQQQPRPQRQPLPLAKKGLFVKVFLITSLVAVLAYGAEEFYQYRHEKKVYEELTKDYDELSEKLSRRKNRDSESQDSPKASKKRGKGNEEEETVRLKYCRADFRKKDDPRFVDGDAVRLAINNALKNSNIVALQSNKDFSINSTGNYSYYGSNPEEYFNIADATVTVDGHVGESLTEGTFTMEATVVCRKKDAEVGYESAYTVKYDISGNFFPSRTFVRAYEFSGKGSIEGQGELQRYEKLVKQGVDPVSEINERLEDGGDLFLTFDIVKSDDSENVAKSDETEKVAKSDDSDRPKEGEKNGKMKLKYEMFFDEALPFPDFGEITENYMDHGTQTIRMDKISYAEFVDYCKLLESQPGWVPHKDDNVAHFPKDYNDMTQTLCMGDYHGLHVVVCYICDKFIEGTDMPHFRISVNKK